MFTHLHLHTEFSLLDGLSRIEQALDRVKQLGQEAVAITDHGNLYGAIDFYKAAHKRGIKPLIGIEAYVAPGSRLSRDPREKSPFHLGLIARNEKGFRNLLALSSGANLDGYYYKPRMDRELFEKHADGLLALSGCPSSEVHRALQDGRRDDAIAAIKWYREVFDGHYYLEIQEHHDEQFSRINPILLEIGRELGIPVVVTNDSHYTSPEDEEAHDILLCIGTNSVVSDPKRMRMEGGSYYIKSETEMASLFPDNPEVIANTWKVAESVEPFTLEFGRLQLPDPELPDGLTPMQHLARISWAGLARLYPAASEEVKQRMEYELSVVDETGFPSYILLVSEFAQYAHDHRIPFGVRGSAAASIILYCIGITDIDPMKHRLVFERFLNRERREMPDIDMDIADDRRAELIRYVADRFGHDRVAQIITYGTLGAKAAIRDVGRALGMSPADTDRLARLVPTTLHMTIDRALKDSSELRQIYDSDPAVRKLVDTARQVEGIARHASTHAAGVVIAKDPLVENVPLQRPSRSDDQSLPMVCWDMNTVAEIGLLKMDFLGLSNLTILGKAVDLIRETRGIDLVLKDLEDGDEKTYEMLKKGETFGVFQLESSGMRRHIQELRPGSIAELSAMVALYRPGPMAHIPAYCKSKHGEAPVRYPHPDLAEILDETYGIIVYQDQVLLIAQKFGGYTLGQADIMRKAMGKKIAEKMRAERENFRGGAVARGYTAEDADKIFDLIEPFAGYAFNKAHATCYGTISYQTAYLKSNYAAEYMTAVLSLAENHPAGFADRVSAAVAECAKLEIPILAPDVNQSEISFRIEQTGDGESGIRFGLATIKNVGEGAVEGLIEERNTNGRFVTLEDFCRRASLKSFNKRMLESLVKAGALDCFGAALGDGGRGQYRSTLLFNLDRIMSLIQREQKLRDAGQTTMFDMFGDSLPTPMPDLELLTTPSLPQRDLLGFEKELLGVYVSEHPFLAASLALASSVDMLINEVSAEVAGRGEIRLAGMVTGTRPLLTRDGRAFCAATIEDLTGQAEVTVWPDQYEAHREIWTEGKILRLTARVRQRDERLNVSVISAAEYDPASAGGVPDAIRDAVQEVERYAAPKRQEPANGYRNGKNGNGYRNGNGNGATTPSGPPPRLLVRIEITERPESEDDDRRRLNELVQQLRGAPGKDSVRLVLITRADRHELELPPIALTPQLEDQVKPMLTRDNWGQIHTEAFSTA